MAEIYNGVYVDQTRTLEASTTHLVTGVPTTGVAIPAHKNGVVAVLDVTAAANLVGDTLDVIVQTKIGSGWYDAIWFTQCLGNGGAKTYVAKIDGSTAMAEYETGTSLAGGERDIFGDLWRVRRVLAGGGGEDFTYSVVICTF